MVLLIFTLVATQTRREISADGAPQAGLLSLSDAPGGDRNNKIAYSSAAKTVVLPCQDKFFTLFDLLETILDPGVPHQGSYSLVEVIEKDLSKKEFCF
jgi:hypothetical protein